MRKPRFRASRLCVVLMRFVLGSVIHASTTVLELILCHEQCDVDLQNKLERDTPLHLAVRIRLALHSCSGEADKCVCVN